MPVQPISEVIKNHPLNLRNFRKKAHYFSSGMNFLKFDPILSLYYDIGELF